MTKFLTAVSITLGVLGLFFLITGGNGSPTGNTLVPQVMSLPTMLLGIGLIAAGCLTAILGRIAQADAHYRRAPLGMFDVPEPAPEDTQ